MSKSMHLSFQDGEEWMYDRIMKHSNHSGYVKDCLKEQWKSEDNKSQNTQTFSNEPNNSFDDPMAMLKNFL